MNCDGIERAGYGTQNTDEGLVLDTALTGTTCIAKI
jgi:hypothetical protein